MCKNAINWFKLIVWDFRRRHQHHTAQSLTKYLVDHRSSIANAHNENSSYLNHCAQPKHEEVSDPLKSSIAIAMSCHYVKHCQAAFMPLLPKASSFATQPGHWNASKLYMMKHKCFSRACWSKWHLLSFLICTKPIPSAGNWKFKLRPGYDMSRRPSTSQVLLPRWEYLTLSIHPRWSGPASHSSKRKPIPSAIAWQFHSNLDVLLDHAVLHHTLSIFILVVVQAGWD